MTCLDPATGELRPDGASDDKLDRGVLVVAGVVVLGAIMSILDITVVSVALDTFQSEFDATSAQVAWTMTGYTLALASVIPLTGWAADRFGTKRLYLLAVVLFTLGSVLCAMATSLEMLVAFRVLQGLGGGMLMPLGMTILTRAAGPERVGRVMAVLGIPMLLGPIFGPILGGWLIEIASWHWIFLINLPIGIAALVYAARVLPADDVEPSETFDLVGMLLLSPGLAAFLYGISSIPETGTVADAQVLAPAIIGLLLIVAFVPWALRPANAHPLVDLRLFGNRDLTVAVLSLTLFGVAFFGASLLFPLYFIQVRDESTLSAGVLLAPQGIGAMVTMPLAGVLVDKIGPGRIVLVGLTVITGAFALLTQIDHETSYLYVLGALFVMGLGMGGTMMPLMTAALRTLSDHTVARGSTLLNIVQQVGASIGTAVFSVLLTNGLRDMPSVRLGTALSEAGVDPSDPGQAAAVAEVAGRLGVDPSTLGDVLPDMAAVFADTFVVAAVLVGVCLVPAFFLPRKPSERKVDPAAMVGH
ncbi:DHA2 family efflux MFS transporter permease subunit [Nocardioides sp. ChNu-153]|uniref:DHA2 family efflux MFS transporter permease subunit n=1 Tax=unclassified Nocardioides TaxID=2615069 RepID=UPI002404918A|nr:MULTISPECIES: DHA2 family efflux MFS transporter permease subunit [unclassified Nocardioides]MDF9716673.1 DHA2 family efflux MFS transporter permease subunit [Nocardioides sp. ChNu-99]MDN7123038.1 DHA2 family efflux MFS transporter permease subunit [Nocardioides sp. ChNu-153]